MGFKVVIPARYASTRLPGKPLVSINNRPLIHYVWEKGLLSGADEVIVATDDERVRNACEKFGAKVMMTSKHHRSGSDRLAEVAHALSWTDDTVVVNLQGDEPLTPPAIIGQVANNLRDHPQAVMATLCVPITDAQAMLDPHQVKVVMDIDGYALYFSRAPIPWERDAAPHMPMNESRLGWRHIGMYAYRAGFLQRYAQYPACCLEDLEKLEQLRVLWYGHKIHVAEACEVPGHGIDTFEDLEALRRLMR